MKDNIFHYSILFYVVSFENLVFTDKIEIPIMILNHIFKTATEAYLLKSVNMFSTVECL